MPVITLPDGTKKHLMRLSPWRKLPRVLAAGLAKAAIAGKVNGKLVDTFHAH